MKAVALITLKSDGIKAQWQFDLIMSAIAYDLDLSLIFIHEGCHQIIENKAWNCLPLYGVTNVYFYHNKNYQLVNNTINAKAISNKLLKQLISNAALIL